MYYSLSILKNPLLYVPLFCRVQIDSFLLLLLDDLNGFSLVSGIITQCNPIRCFALKAHPDFLRIESNNRKLYSCCQICLNKYNNSVGSCSMHG